MTVIFRIDAKREPVEVINSDDDAEVTA
jgi:hypothetical protein